MKTSIQIAFLMTFVFFGWITSSFLPTVEEPIDPVVSPSGKANRTTTDTVEFNRDIRPILADKCFACHGPDAAQRQADFRLDLRDEALRDLGGYAAIVPGKPDESELISRIFSDDEDEIMPPTDHLKKLSAREKELLKKWVQQGAKWQDHWSLIPLKETKTPQPKNLSWAKNDIDRFILRKLESAKLKPSNPADKRILIRRLYFDLIGLPPTPAQVDAFVADKSPDAYEKVVDQLLASKHFGERLAIYWLDLVRYADTVGYHGDQSISISPYRDYVINAFNNNMPFDQFTREQLAGDLIKDATLQQKIASGYNRLGMMSAEGGVQPEEYLAKYAADRVRTTASVWLGVTLGCAECHDHKFDPFTITDFYNFASFFADIKEKGLYSGANSTGDWGPKVVVPHPQLAEKTAPFDKKIAELEAELNSQRSAVVAAQQKWEDALRKQRFDWQPLKPAEFSSYYKTKHEVLKDKSVLMTGEATNEDAYVIRFKMPEANVTGIRLEALPHFKLPQMGPGRAGNGNFVVTQLIAVRGNQTNIEELKKIFNRWPKNLKQQALPLANATATYEQTASAKSHPDKKWSAKSAIDRDKNGPTFGWAIMPEKGKPNSLVVQIPQGAKFKKGEFLTIVLHQYHGSGNHLLGRFRISVTVDKDPLADPLKALPGDLSMILLAKDKRTPKQAKRLTDHFISVTPIFASQRKKINELKKQKEKIVKQLTRTSLITVAVKPREMRVLARGNWMDKSGKIAQPQTPGSLPTLPKIEGRPTRTDLANWIVSKENPLTARVFVNRLWKLYFGSGIAKVLDDFGSQGGWPSHPELLDYLASEFVNNDWNVKHMVRLMVTSATYRQSSKHREDLQKRDPENQLLARQARFRLDAELIRDNALAVSGLLIRKIGGRSVKPYQPPGLYRHLNFPPRKYQSDNGENQFRRGLYTHWQRQFLHPAMKSFDAPAREECTCERPQSNTPLSALVLLNDPSYVEAARNMAALAYKQNLTTDQQRITWMFRQALTRDPNKREIEVLGNLLIEHQKYFSENPKAAKALNAIGISTSKTDAPSDLAAMTSVARTILNLHEFITRN